MDEIKLEDKSCPTKKKNRNMYSYDVARVQYYRYVVILTAKSFVFHLENIHRKISNELVHGKLVFGGNNFPHIWILIAIE